MKRFHRMSQMWLLLKNWKTCPNQAHKRVVQHCPRLDGVNALWSTTCQPALLTPLPHLPQVFAPYPHVWLILSFWDLGKGGSKRFTRASWQEGLHPKTPLSSQCPGHPPRLKEWHPWSTFISGIPCLCEFLHLAVSFACKKKSLLGTHSLLNLRIPKKGIYYIILRPYFSPLPFSLKNVQWINCENLRIFPPRQHIHLPLPQNKFQPWKRWNFRSQDGCGLVAVRLRCVQSAGCYPS